MLQEVVLRVLNHLLGQAAWARRQLLPFAGRVARFQSPPWELTFAVALDGGLAPQGDAVPDVTVAVPPLSPLLLADGLPGVMAQAHVTGNAEFATALSFVLRNLRWDAEEDLARRLGDIPARRLLTCFRGLDAQVRRSGERLAESLAAYVSNEVHLLASPTDLADFRADVEDMATRLERLAARVSALPRPVV